MEALEHFSSKKCPARLKRLLAPAITPNLPDMRGVMSAESDLTPFRRRRAAVSADL
jgi:hypothetical protein